jgi:dolichol kinase
MTNIPLSSIVLLVLLVIFQAVVAHLSLPRETKRRCQHAFTGHALVVVSYGLSHITCLILLAVAMMIIYYLRYYQHELYLRALGGLLRSPEKEPDGALPGAFYFLAGTFVAILLFPMDTARFGVECLSWADPMASLVGSNVKSFQLHDSASLAGSVASFITALGVGWCFMANDKEKMIPLLCSAVACSLTEAFSFNYDNLLIPVATAGTWHLASMKL